MTDVESHILPEVAERATQFRLMGKFNNINHIVMRKIHETKLQKGKPKLDQLLKGLKGGILQRMETRKKILDLYECEEDERHEIERQKKQELKKFMDEGDEQEKNITFVDLKIKVKKAMADLQEQERVLAEMKDKLLETLGAEGFFIK